MKIENLEIYDSMYFPSIFDEIWKMKFKFTVSCSV